MINLLVKRQNADSFYVENLRTKKSAIVYHCSHSICHSDFFFIDDIAKEYCKIYYKKEKLDM